MRGSSSSALRGAVDVSHWAVVRSSVMRCRCSRGTAHGSGAGQRIHARYDLHRLEPDRMEAARRGGLAGAEPAKSSHGRAPAVRAAGSCSTSRTRTSISSRASAARGRVRQACCSGCERPATGMTGVYVSLQDDDLKTYRITLDAEGRETARDALRPAAPFLRVAPPPVAPMRMRPRAARRRLLDGRRGPRRRTRQAAHAACPS